MRLLWLSAVLAVVALAVTRVGAKPSFTMPDGDGDEEEAAVAEDSAEVDEQGNELICHFKSSLKIFSWQAQCSKSISDLNINFLQEVLKPPVTELPIHEAEEEIEETPARTSSKGTFSLLLSKGSWFKSFFRYFLNVRF